MHSDQDSNTSDSSSNAYSQQLFESPQSSPQQQVPQLTISIAELRCQEKRHTNIPGISPYLKILEQPQAHFRFRYMSEMAGAHGSLLGRAKSLKSHPTVELVNYKYSAVIRCELVQEKSDTPHPHQLLVNEEIDSVSAEVNPVIGYQVKFAGMGIIHTGRKEVVDVLLKKNHVKDDYAHGSGQKKSQVRKYFEEAAKSINQNIVRLKFSAYDSRTQEQICQPVFSDMIHNMKSAATNDLRICRMSSCKGKAVGGEDIFMFVEKINKKNIEIRFFETSEDGEEIWMMPAHFLSTDVHHQYAVVFRTPAYKDIYITSNVKVNVVLYRPSDQRTSEPMEFTYTPHPIYQSNSKKRRHGSTGSSNASLNSLIDVPVSVTLANNAQLNTLGMEMIHYQEIKHETNKDLGDAFYDTIQEPAHGMAKFSNPLLAMTTMPLEQDLDTSVTSSLLNQLLEPPPQEFFDDLSLDSDYINYICGSTNTQLIGEPMKPEQGQLVPDSGRRKQVQELPRFQSGLQNTVVVPAEFQKPTLVTGGETSGGVGYKAVYTKEDGERVGVLLDKITVLLKERKKDFINNAEIRTTIDALFNIRLSNGDTFLHMTIAKNVLRTAEFIVKLINKLKMTQLLNAKNELDQTILHLAIVNELPDMVAFLISKGCNPNEQDIEGNAALHNAVIYEACLRPLIAAMDEQRVPYDLNVTNEENQTPLHLAAIYKSASNCKTLLSHGADTSARDKLGRTALHLAALDDSLPVLTVLLQYIEGAKVDETDCQGYTALQLVCARSIGSNSSEIARLLLENGADPLKHEGQTDPAWALARSNEKIREEIIKYMPAMVNLFEQEVDDVKSEAEEDYESAEEFVQEMGLAGIERYVKELADLLDRSGAWRALAVRLEVESLVNWYEKSPSPTETLLSQVKECRAHITSASLAKILKDMGEPAAASVILKHINE